MAIQNPTRKALPIEVRGSAAQPLGMSATQFLRDYWQKRPLLIRNAFPDFEAPIEPNDLAGLACEEGVLARLIVHDEKRDRWTVKNGPFDEATFGKTPKRDWTLLVQDVDKWDADVAALLDSFAFLPTWRVDDIMISYAEDGGGVGAHVDQYDVFLLQGLGQRHWAISNDPDAPLDFRDDVELKQLKTFEPTHEWLLEPGDMLYLPPGVPHDGVAIGDCMTLSLGMRAPSQAELTGDLADFLAERMPEELRYTDPDLAPAKRAGEIDSAALNRVRQAVPFASALDRDLLADWFGRFITRYRNAQDAVAPPKATTAAALDKSLEGGASFVRHPYARIAWIRGKKDATLYVSGHAYECPVDLAERLAGERDLAFDALLPAAARTVLLALVNDGHLAVRKGSPPVTEPADTRLSAGDRTGLEAAHVRLLAGARHRACLYLPVLEPGMLESEAALAELRRLATSGRQARIRLLTHDANRAHRDGHRLLALAQRLPTAIGIRVPTDETHLRYGSAFVTDEASAFLFRSVATRYEAEGDLDRPGETSRLTAYFDEVWERAEPAWEIRPLGI